ncbi:MAG: hypothetical protein ACRD27_06050 [Terracidiphilus sp.]
MRKTLAFAGLLLFVAAAALAQTPDSTATPAGTPSGPPTGIATATQPVTQPTALPGTWKGAFEFNGESMPLTLHLGVAGNAVTGTVEGLPTTPAEIHDGKLDGDTVSFWLNTDYQGTTYKLVFTGKAAADQIAFTFGTDDGSWSAPLIVTRGAAQPAAPDVTGTWKGAFDFNGGSVPLTFHLASAAGAVTGTVEGLPTTPAEIHDGKIDGGTLTFWLTTDYQGEQYKLLYTGKIAAGQIVFSFGTDDGSWSANLTAMKSL